MNLNNLFESLNEDWTTVRDYDKERYTELPGLEGPIPTKSGKVMYYDPKQGQYYDRDSDMYLDHDEALAFLNEEFQAKYNSPLFDDEGNLSSNQRTERILKLLRVQNPSASNDLEALVLGFEKGQKQDRSDISTLYSQNRSEEQDIDDLEKALDAIKKRRGVSEESDKERAERAAMDNVKAMIAQKQADAAKQPKAEPRPAPKDPHADKSMTWKKGFADGKAGRMDPRASDAYGPRVGEYEAGYTAGSKVNEDYYDTDEQRELARLGRIIMDMGAKRDDDIGAAMGAVGMELTKYGTPQGVSSIQKLEKVTGQPESVIMKMMALAQKVQGDVAVGDDVPDEEELEEAKAKANFDVEDLYKLQNIDDLEKLKKSAFALISKPSEKPMKPEKVSWFQRSLEKMNTKDRVMKLMWDLFMSGEGLAVQGTRFSTDKSYYRKAFGEADFDTNFKKRIGYTVRGGAASDMMKKQAAQVQQMNKDLDPGAAEKGLGIGVLDVAKARKKAKEKGVRAPGSLRSSPNTKDPKRLPEAKEDDIKIGDTVQTLKMGQMQGTVTGFSKKGGIDKVMFKHESGKTYATVPENLKVISSKKSESQVAENIDLRHDLKPGIYKHKLQNIQVSIDDNGSVTFMQPAQWEIEDDQEYLEYVESQLAMPEYWTASVEEAEKKPTPTQPDKWAYAKSQAKKKFDVYPSAYANAWAAKKYKELGGGWR